jgi:dipeptidyl aminopeptidase/acylaminoacyl peptidase
LIAGLACWVVLWTTAAAAAPKPLEISAYGVLPAIDFMQLAPSGAKLALVSVSGDVRSLVVKDLAGAVLFSAPLGAAKVRDIAWAGDDHLLVSASQTQRLDVSDDSEEFTHVIALNLTTKKLITVFANREDVFSAVFGGYGTVEIGGHWYGFFGGVTLNKTRGFAASLNSRSFPDLYRVDLDTGRIELVDKARQPRDWVVDRSGAVIAYSEYDGKSGVWSLYAGAGGAALFTSREPTHDIALAGAGRTSGTAIVDTGTDEEWSPATKAHTHLPVDGGIGGFIHDPASGYLVGIVLEGDRRDQMFFDPALQAKLSGLRKALGASASLVSWSSNGKQVIALTDGGSDPGTYWLLNGKEAKALAYAYPSIPDANVGNAEAIEYHAGDGLAIHAILTLPPGRDARRLPLVVLPHGGPEGHDALGFDWWAQAFAGRGYAVLQPNFRGSDNYGKEFRDAGFGEWGRKMQTDISDGVADLARQGIIDPARVCVVGGSYGGYAALAGVTVQQGLYRCAVSVAGVSDLNYMLSWETRLQGADARNATTRYWRRFMGAKDDGDPALRALSPAQLAARADAPVLLIHGADDTVVPLKQSEMMEQALRKAGKPVEMVVLKSEDHWLSRGATRTAMLQAATRFVEANNPPD